MEMTHVWLLPERECIVQANDTTYMGITRGQHTISVPSISAWTNEQTMITHSSFASARLQGHRTSTATLRADNQTDSRWPRFLRGASLIRPFEFGQPLHSSLVILRCARPMSFILRAGWEDAPLARMYHFLASARSCVHPIPTSQ